MLRAHLLLPARMAPTVWTIGHSTRSLDEFLGLLRSYEVEEIADVRSFPGSRKYPHFGQEALAQALREQGVAYEWFKELGGRRRPDPDSPHTSWRNASFRAYADYMQTPAFQEALHELMERASNVRIALMCAEAVWWRCHRSMVSDALCVQGLHVVHIMDERHETAHPMTGPARVVDGRLSYLPEKD